MKILKILNGNDDGGVFTCEIQFIKELKKRGWVVDGIIVGRGKSYDRYIDVLNGYVELPKLSASFAGRIPNILRGLRQAYKYGRVNSSSEAILNLNGNYNAIIYRRVNLLFLAGFLGKRLGIKRYWHMPNVVSNSFSYIAYNLFFKLFKIEPIANSEYTRSTIGNMCKSVIYPGFDRQRVQGGNAVYRTKFNIPSGAPVYGIVSRITPDKAQDIVVEAFLKSGILENGGYLLIAGGLENSDFVDKVRKAAFPYEGKSVFLLGKITDLSNFYSSIDVAINGRRNVEPFGISVAEALGAGVPVLSYSAGGPKEMIIQKYNGWLVEEPTVESYREVLKESLKDRDQWLKFGENAQAHARKFSVPSNVEKLSELILCQR